MLRKVLFGALTLLLALSLVGCGGKKDGGAAKPDESKPAEVAVEGSPDKAVLAYAQLHAYGTIADENKAAAGMTDADIEKVQEQVITPFVDAFKVYPLSDESVKTMEEQYVEKLHAAMNIKATIKTEDKEHPVVTLTATTIDMEGVAKIVETNADLVALGSAYGELRAQGLTEEQLKESPEFQQFAVESVSNFINEFPFNPEAGIDVTCDIVKGSDGKSYWTPQDPAAVEKFVSGQK